MMTRLQWKVVGMVSSCVLALYFLYPSMVWYSKSPEKRQILLEANSPLAKKIVNLGLDLQGGMHMILELDEEKLEDDSDESVRDALERAIEVIRNRVDAIGVAEPLIIRQGKNWIVVQLPGVKDRDEARKMIGKTALLEFRLVESGESFSDIDYRLQELALSTQTWSLDNLPQELLDVIPEGTEIVRQRRDAGGGFLLVKSTPELTGAYLQDARVELGGDYSGFPVVGLEFNPEGAKLFARITGANVQRRLAILLDGIVQSAPTIDEAIPSGRAIIRGTFSPEDAKFLARILKAGALPAPLRLVEERTVGPRLGEDSINAGLLSCLIGGIFVLVFMVMYYRKSGLIADVALLINLLFLLAAMATLHATLTLPGIAGIILTVGMAVDANVLIFERIREELAKGKTVRLAIDEGYSKALSAILDGNITTLVAALFLFQFGTGPIKGFAITLILGLSASMLTAIVFTRTIYEVWMTKRKVQTLSI